MNKGDTPLEHEMKTSFVVCYLILISPLSWGSENLFLFFRDHQLGLKVTSGNQEFNELPDIEILGQIFSTYHELDAERKI